MYISQFHEHLEGVGPTTRSWTYYGYSPHHEPGGLLAGAVPQLLGRMILQPQVGGDAATTVWKKYDISNTFFNKHILNIV